MDAFEILVEAAGRIPGAAQQALSGIDSHTLHSQPAGRGNSIAWLVWHAARQLDAQLAALSGDDQVWSRDDWSQRLGIDRGPQQIGFGDSVAEVAALRVSDPTLLTAYLEAAVAALVDYLATAPALDEVVDTRWDPPVTRGVRLVSIIDDAVAHLGQAAYVRGVVSDWNIGY
ncbi:MAG: DinB family protein [Propionibacteriales bacterium]|nr:DinB family protein [Propionibacteriales bacterium]